MQNSDWLKRPVNKKMISYLEADVKYLNKIYKFFNRKLKKNKNLEFFNEEMNNINVISNLISSSAIRKKINHQNIKLKQFQDLLKFREKIAKQKNIPKNWVFKDEDINNIIENKNYLNLKKNKNLNINEKDKVCEIGCGWGGFINSLTTQFANIDLNAFTISQNQYNFVNQALMSKVNNNVKLNFTDYRNINQKFDKIISIEMFEAVGKKYWDVYFEKLNKSLNNGGQACLQIITINENSFKNYLNNVDFIQKYIFPGGVLPSKKVLFNLFKKYKLELVHQIDFANDYCKTLIEWKKRFNDNWHTIKNDKFNERFKRIWNYYFDYCETGFALKHTDVSQFYLKKIA